MENKVEKLEESVVANIKELNSRKTQLFIEVGQIHLELRELKTMLDKRETQFDATIGELNSILFELEQKYPSGEIDLLEGTVTY
jgi:predicted enzyme involved in methoxymalonyl-ACP biosynthesis